jgi:hypothetical protein
MGDTFPSTLPGTLTLTAVGPVNGMISGSFELGQAPNVVQGTFNICRGPDIDAP